MSFERKNFSIDAKHLLTVLEKNYGVEVDNCEDLKILQKKIKCDFKQVENFVELCRITKYPMFELIVCLHEIFPKMFTMKTISKITDILVKIDNQDLEGKTNVNTGKIIRNMASRSLFI